MAAPVNPSFGAKASLVTGRALQSAFDTPAKMTVAAGTTGAVTNAFITSVNASAKESYAALQPRGPAKWLEGLFAKVDKATAQSVEQADKATKLFWVPFSEGSHRTGNAAAFPFAARYADKVGIEIPKEPAAADKLLAELLAAKGFPVPAAKPEGEEPVPPAKPGEGDPTTPAEPGKPGDTEGTPPAEPGKPGDAEGTPPAEPGKPGDAEGTPPAEPGKPEGDGTPAPAEPSNPDDASAATQPQSTPPADAAPAEAAAPAAAPADAAPAGPAPAGPAPTGPTPTA
ncbi:MAG: hypothetical protein JWM25_1991 [Thermoleophilia bacterium]|nr:hypothetical protein [Thermoleophilia bacterium]MCZ4497406.1 hypothetical protein [Thermoleophilia bacterium]